MARPLILGIIGEKSSGKSIVFEYLAKHQRVHSGRTSAVLEDILRRLHLDIAKRENYLMLAESLRHDFGSDILPRVIIADAKGKRVALIAIEGIRRLAELAPLRCMRQFRLLYITAPVETRWRRAQARTKKKRNDDHVSLATYRRIERTFVTEREIPRMGKLADFRIDNTGTKRELFRKVDALLCRLLP